MCEHAERTHALNTCQVPTNSHTGLGQRCHAQAPCGGTGSRLGERGLGPVPPAPPLWASRSHLSRREMLRSPRAPGVGQAGARSPTLPRPTQSVARVPPASTPRSWGLHSACTPRRGPSVLCWCMSDVQLGVWTGGSWSGGHWLVLGEDHHGHLRTRVTRLCDVCLTMVGKW